MIQPGLVSITFRKLSAAEIVSLVQRAGLQAIEWGGDVHVPPGDLQTAALVRRMTVEAGLDPAIYGSYYRVGEAASLPTWSALLDSASALGARAIRVWAGTKDYAVADTSYRAQVIDDLKRITRLAAERDLQVVLEHHNGTLCDAAESTLDVLQAVKHPALRAGWQTLGTMDDDAQQRSLDALKPFLGSIHVFQWTRRPDGIDRHALLDGEQAWRHRLATVAHLPVYALIEYVLNDAPEQFLADAAVLKRSLIR